MKKIPSLDGFRAISIILVLIAHSRFCIGFPKQYTDIAAHGDIGVIVFFVISGFLITTLLLREYSDKNHISIKGFYIRRALRILPVFFLYTLFILTWGGIRLSNSDFFHTFSFTVNFARPDHSWYIGHFWTLSVEEQFYFFWPVILILFRKNLKAVLGILIIYSWISRVIAYSYPGYAAVTLSPYFSASDPIMIGALGGILIYENPLLVKVKVFSNYIFQLAAIITILLCLYLPTHYKIGVVSLPFGNTIISIAILFLILSYITPSEGIIYRILNSRVMVHLGVLSYSIYVWQQFFMMGTTSVLRELPINILITYLVALTSYYLWERPFLILKNFIGNKNMISKRIIN